MKGLHLGAGHPTILAAIVTHNRSMLLERCIDHVLKQTRPPDNLLIVNNGSTDGTEAMLRRKRVEFITQPNLGGAGGFNRAIQYALDEDYDFVWLMDDDGFPDRFALGILAETMRDAVACASSVILREDDTERFVFPVPLLGPTGHPVIFGWPRKVRTPAELKEIHPATIYPFAHLFNGALVSVEAIRRVGNVNTEFFIFGDEIDFGMRLRRAGPVVSHVDALHYHPDVGRRPLSDVKVYYYIKNTIILNHRYFDWPWLRDLLTIGVALARITSRNGFAQGFSYVCGRKSGLIRKAIWRGLRGKVGADFAR